MFESRESYGRSTHRRYRGLHPDTPVIKILHRISDQFWTIVLRLDPSISRKGDILELAYIRSIDYPIKRSSIDRVIKFERYWCFLSLTQLLISHDCIIGITSISSHLGCMYSLFGRSRYIYHIVGTDTLMVCFEHIESIFVPLESQLLVPRYEYRDRLTKKEESDKKI